MRRGAAPLVWLLIGGLLSAGCRERKKLIEFGWDIPDTAFLRTHAREIDDSPFDGVVFQVQARAGGSAAASLSWRAFGRQAFSEADVAQARRDLRATRLRRVRSNFLRLNTTPFDLDWFDDFSSVLGNAELAARLARAGRSRGILLDTEAYEAPLFRFVCRMLGRGRSDAAGDLTQEVFLRIIGSLDRIDPARPLKPFIYRIAANAAVDHLRREGRRGRFLDRDVIAADLTDGARSARSRETSLDLERSLALLPVHYQLVVVLRFAQELTYEDISEALEIPVGTVKTYLHRARRALKQSLEEGT